jgi:hypothetical protein
MRRPVSHLAATTVAGRRRTSRGVCLRWLPDWLLEIYLLSLMFDQAKTTSIAWFRRCGCEPSYASRNAVLSVAAGYRWRVSGRSLTAGNPSLPENLIIR